MPSVKAIYEDGQVVFPDGNGPEGRMEVVVIFPDQSKPAPPRTKDRNAGKRFVQKWKGILKDVNIEGWEKQRIADLEKKHQ